MLKMIHQYLLSLVIMLLVNCCAFASEQKYLLSKEETLIGFVFSLQQQHPRYDPSNPSKAPTASQEDIDLFKRQNNIKRLLAGHANNDALPVIVAWLKDAQLLGELIGENITDQQRLTRGFFELQELATLAAIIIDEKDIRKFMEKFAYPENFRSATVSAAIFSVLSERGLINPHEQTSKNLITFKKNESDKYEWMYKDGWLYTCALNAFLATKGCMNYRSILEEANVEILKEFMTTESFKQFDDTYVPSHKAVRETIGLLFDQMVSLSNEKKSFWPVIEDVLANSKEIKDREYVNNIALLKKIGIDIFKDIPSLSSANNNENNIDITVNEKSDAISSDEFFWSAKDTIKMSILVFQPCDDAYGEDGKLLDRPFHILGDMLEECYEQLLLHANPKAVDLLIDSFQNPHSETNFNKIGIFGEDNFFFLMDLKYVDIIIDLFSKISLDTSCEKFNFYTILSDRGFVFSKEQKEFLLKVLPYSKVDSPQWVSAVETRLRTYR